MNNKTSLFVVPRASTAWRGNEAGWITTAGWAAAGQQLWGHSVVATTDGVFTPQECMLFPRTLGKTVSGTPGKLKSLRQVVPEFMITAYKDWNLKRSKPKVWPIENSNLIREKQVKMVWERHDLFPGAGRRLADQLKVPLVTSVEALAVWEANKWGVKRPIWGTLLEKYVEAESLKKSDLVSCVSEEVREKVIAMGVEKDKVIVSHNRVDSSVFNPMVDGKEFHNRFNLKNKRVIGWTGSFRGFHAIDTLIHAFKKVHDKHPDTLLMLVGDGMEFEKMKGLAAKLGLSDDVIMPGRYPVTQIPFFLANFHIALVSARSAEGFHYSPLKLREYQATGKAIIAPRAGDLPDLFKDGTDLLFYEAGDASDLADKLIRLLEDTGIHSSLIKNAIEFFKHEGTWLHELKKVCDRLAISY